MNAEDPAEVDTDGGSRLLNMSAELRNLVYAQVLLSNERIEINKQNYEQPGLLRVNRQIRQEARPIYYRQNKFIIRCPDFDHRALQALYMQSKDVMDWTVGRSPLLPILSIRPENGREPRNWCNLFKWLKALHESTLQHCISPTKDPGRAAAAAMMLVARDLRDLPWNRVKFILRDVATARKGVKWTGTHPFVE